jgi:hypothetical protein
MFISSQIFNKGTFLCSRRDTGWHSSLRQCATSLKCAGSIPHDVTLPHYGPKVDSTSNRNEYQGYFLGGKCGRCVWLTTLLVSCVDCLEIWEPQPPGTLRDCNTSVQGSLVLCSRHNNIQGDQKVSVNLMIFFSSIATTCPLWTTWSPLPAVAEV